MNALSEGISSSAPVLYDVIISGAGPVGLFLAAELARAQCSVLVLEKAAQPQSVLKKLPFGMRGLSAPTVETLYRRNLLDELEVPKHHKSPFPLPPGSQAPRLSGHFAGIPLREQDIDPSKWPWQMLSPLPAQLLSELQELEDVLTAHAVRLGVCILRGHAVTGLTQLEDQVVVQSDGHIFQARWLVGCDGSRSAVRKLAGFDFEGTEPEFTGYTAKVDIDHPELLQPGRVTTPEGMYFQSQPGYLILQDFDKGAFHATRQPVTQERLQALLQRISGTEVTITEMHVATTWTDRSRQATAYRNGRVLLAGDAAHIHSPLGGQGLNLGIGDAMNLGWKLAATIRQQAPDALLGTYQQERHPIGAQVLDWSRAQVAIMRPDAYGRALNAIFRDLLQTTGGATYAAGRIRGVMMRYDLAQDHPLAGRSVPEFELEDGRTVGMLLRDHSGILLDFEANEALQAAARDYPEISCLTIKAGKPPGLTAMLIRPDGIVAWVAESTPDTGSFHTAAARWFLKTM